jgi:alpha-amylase
VETDFGPRVKLHDYSDSNAHNLETDGNGVVRVKVPPGIRHQGGPVGTGGGFAPRSRRTTQEFQLDDDLGDARSSSPQYGGQAECQRVEDWGAIWAAERSVVKVWVYTDGKRDAELHVYKLDVRGQQSKDQGQVSSTGETSNHRPLYLEFQTDAEGNHQVAAKITNADQAPTWAYWKGEYAAPATSSKF